MSNKRKCDSNTAKTETYNVYLDASTHESKRVKQCDIRAVTPILITGSTPASVSNAISKMLSQMSQPSQQSAQYDNNPVSKCSPLPPDPPKTTQPTPNPVPDLTLEPSAKSSTSDSSPYIPITIYSQDMPTLSASTSIINSNNNLSTISTIGLHDLFSNRIHDSRLEHARILHRLAYKITDEIIKKLDGNIVSTKTESTSAKEIFDQHNIAQAIYSAIEKRVTLN